MSPSFFEGPEKKVELVVVSGGPSLRALGEQVWRRVVEAANADVLSIIRTAELEAYLLSESSLFVYDDHITMITCGQTTLVEAVLLLIEEVGRDNVALLIYERKNEHFPERQPSSFFDDASRLAQLIPGAALQFGSEHDHRIFVFHSTRAHRPDPNDTTLEILMHGIDGERAARFCSGRQGRGDVASRYGLDQLLPGFEIDEHSFEPAGYSLNAVKEREYYTIHVTPEELGSYVSFETNHDFRRDPVALVGRIVDCFGPESFDVFSFCPSGGDHAVALPGYHLRKHVTDHLSGYDVTFQHFFRPSTGPESALAIELSK
ncbi:MAG: adenosylmethionine decarboxylase [Deltaproteobacteria bacterium]|nr:adenosylmethionine decarboxylase [Deltaproteobacteria bacterium]